MDYLEGQFCELREGAREHAGTFEDNIDPLQHVGVVVGAVPNVLHPHMHPHLQIPSVVLSQLLLQPPAHARRVDGCKIAAIGQREYGHGVGVQKLELLFFEEGEKLSLQALFGVGGGERSGSLEYLGEH
jgi:hypothetical protein